MRVKKYEGRTLHEALRKVKEDLGDDGVILYTYQPRQSRFFRLFGGGRCMIFATREVRMLGVAPRA
ncbi:MAG: GTP-binding protein, partial [Planctomycetes bacterium]|nr:GTP-binding protein [Planctomycetota bacterium]